MALERYNWCWMGIYSLVRSFYPWVGHCIGKVRLVLDGDLQFGEKFVGVEMSSAGYKWLSFIVYLGVQTV